MISEEQKQNIFKLRKEGKSILEISIELKIGTASVSKWCDYFDPEGKYKHTHKITEAELDYIKKSYIEEGKSIKSLSKLLNCSPNSIKNILVKENLYFKKINKTTKRQKSLHVINWKQDKKKKLVEYKGGKCEICGYDKCMSALDFHHKNPLEKDFSISSNSFSFEKMKKEVDKCMLICSNCHRELHYNLKQEKIWENVQGRQDAL